jgi:predicted fused transcriptional regulator/phosphomethylpyrimidine kinase
LKEIDVDRRGSTEINLKELDSSPSGLVVDSGKQGKEPSNSIRGREFLD